MLFENNGYSAIQYSNSENFKEKVQTVADLIQKLQANPKTAFDALVVCGKSGMSVAFALKMLMHVNIVVVRKTGDNSHGRAVEGPYCSITRLVFLDDLISSGTTLAKLKRKLSKEAKETDQTAPEVIGAILYGCNTYSGFEHKTPGWREGTKNMQFIWYAA